MCRLTCRLVRCRSHCTTPNCRRRRIRGEAGQTRNRRGECRRVDRLCEMHLEARVERTYSVVRVSVGSERNGRRPPALVDSKTTHLPYHFPAVHLDPPT